MVYQAPFPPYDLSDEQGFSYETGVKRWPLILAGIVDQIHRENHNNTLHLQAQENSAQKQGLEIKIAEGKAIIENINKLKYEMARDHVMEPIPADDELHVDVFNAELEELANSSRNTWFKAPWLYAECYLYRLLRSYFAQSSQWRSFDPFHSQKLDVFTKSGTSIYGIATIMHELEAEKSALESDPEKLKVFFQEMIQMCLWGNATDLSLVTHMSLVDIEKLQTVGKDMQAARKEFIMRDDQEKAWQHLSAVKDGRVDFVLDNAGFELFTDLVFADFLVTYTPYVSKVVFHPKLIPWFISDVTPPDFEETINLLLDPTFLSSTTSPVPTAGQQQHLQQLVDRLKRYILEGVFSLSVLIETPLGGGSAPGPLAGFWTTPYPYWDMETYDPMLWDVLKGSNLVVFKGDLNYRKLTGDVKWPSSTPFNEALGPLAGSFPLLSLRTNKSGVAVGLDEEIILQTEARDPKWRIGGKFALISFSDKTSK